jgi:unsaturated rhamnogalacturonyl hydrolase
MRSALWFGHAALVMTALLGSSLLAQTAPGAAAPPGGRGSRAGGGNAPPIGTLPPDAPGKDAFWGLWPTSDPKVVGTRVALNLVSRPPIPTRNPGVHYAEASTGYGSLRFAQSIGDTALAEKIVARYASVLTPEGRGSIPPADHVDRSVFGIVPLEISRYLKNKPGDNAALAKAYLDIGRNSADLQWAKPLNRQPTAADTALMDAGLTWQTRYWVDDMFMIIGLQTQAFRATGDKVYLDRAALEMASYLDKLQKHNGLFFHAQDTPFYWGRGDGWFAVGMAELLMELPADHPQRARIFEGYRKMMAGLLANQAPDGMWRQLIDKPESWPETSSTGMFTFAFAVGSRKGWLAEPEYKAAARKAWIALCGYLDENANVREICAGTGTAASNTRGGEAAFLQYYLNRPRLVGDLHGQAGMIWAAWAMEAEIK